MNKQNLLFRLMGHLGGHLSFSALIRRSGQAHFMPFYHSLITDVAPPHLRHLYRVRTQRQFEEDLDFFLKHYRPVSLEELAEAVWEDKPLQGNTFLLSFDDGLRSVKELAMPVLLKKGVPATVFVNSGFVDNQDLFFRYKVSLLIDKIYSRKPGTAVRDKISSCLREAGFKKGSIPNRLMQVGYSTRYILDMIAAFLEVDFGDYLKEEQPYLQLAELQAMEEKGFAIGAHSVDHPLFCDLYVQAQIAQVKESMSFVDNHFNTKTRAFSFPFTDEGVGCQLFESIQLDKLASLTFGTAGLKQEDFSFHFQRFPMEISTEPARRLVGAEYFYYITKAIIGKNRIRRP